MKLNALAFILDRNRFLVSRTGSRFVSDSDPGLMSFLFPHLDPWGIGGFNHVARSQNASFRMSKSAHRTLATDLQAVAPLLNDLAEKWTQSSFPKTSNDEEKRALKILRKLQTSFNAQRRVSSSGSITLVISAVFYRINNIHSFLPH
ncbi:hypothetical protein C8R48DRAFT_444341 [Suillus tomentosus]|nr:hypothetical protein C8R48DRAFT_444341 [Suillus tomentosus]